MTANNPASGGARQVQVRTVADNRQARHLYHIEDTLEAGIKLTGWEVKACLAGQATLNGSSAYVRFEGGQAFLENLTITPLPQARKGLLEDLTPIRPRQLLLHATQLKKLERRVAERGMTVVPLALTYGRLLKVNIALVKGKNHADKRETIKARDLDRDINQSISQGLKQTLSRDCS